MPSHPARRHVERTAPANHGRWRRIPRVMGERGQSPLQVVGAATSRGFGFYHGQTRRVRHGLVGCGIQAAYRRNGQAARGRTRQPWTMACPLQVVGVATSRGFEFYHGHGHCDAAAVVVVTPAPLVRSERDEETIDEARP
ncbi:hypothetical protein DCS_05773 [Drechmeria coniospora]|uniref:Uncharacterized protein n=1 Tax=Drechmeria coniospora TaxID=98403 RepID=A0A151GNR8_DRECN|nr:hypothetical protein DCS_05773 [Drechmeria coniospora]KYK58755.1 hypothetical protein DCS_05773 [Drechmeria coniospora]